MDTSTNVRLFFYYSPFSFNNRMLDPTGRILRDAKLYEIGAGTSEIRRMLIGREINQMFKK